MYWKWIPLKKLKMNLLSYWILLCFSAHGDFSQRCFFVSGKCKSGLNTWRQHFSNAKIIEIKPFLVALLSNESFMLTLGDRNELQIHFTILWLIYWSGLPHPRETRFFLLSNKPLERVFSGVDLCYRQKCLFT